MNLGMAIFGLMSQADDLFVSFTGGTVNATGIDPGNATAGVKFMRNGEIHQSVDGVSYSYWKDWHLSKTSSCGDDFELYNTVTGDGLTTGSGGTWLALTADLTFTRTQTGLGSSVAICSIQVRGVTNPSDTDTEIINLEAVVESGA